MGSALAAAVAVDEDVVDAADDDFDEATSLRDSDARPNDDDDDDEDDDDDAADDDDSTVLRSKRRSTASDKLEALPTLALPPLLLLLPPLAPELIPDSATVAGAGIGSMARGCLALPAKHS